MKINLSEVVEKVKGGERAYPHGIAFPDDAEFVGYDDDTKTVTYMTMIDEVLTEQTRAFSQAEIDASFSYTSPADIQSMLAFLWEDFNNFAESEMDQNARVTVTGLPNKVGATPQQLSRAADIMAWWEAHWMLYGQKRAELIATNTMPTYTFTPCPWSIWDLA